MTTEQLDEFLLSYTDSELRRQRDPNYVSQRYQHIARVPFRGREMYLFTFESVLKNSLVCAHKETRFASIPEHIHTVIEFLYVYAGHCTQIIGDRRVEMSAGDICLLDTNVPHSVEYLGKDDIIITLEMRKDYLTHGFFSSWAKRGSLPAFWPTPSLPPRSTTSIYSFSTTRKTLFAPSSKTFCGNSTTRPCAVLLLWTLTSRCFTASSCVNTGVRPLPPAAETHGGS